MAKTKEQKIARALQTETGCVYLHALNVVRTKRKSLELAGKSQDEALDEIASLSADVLGVRQFPK